MIIGGKSFDTKHHTYIMGILNVTPDSFSDGGMYDSLDAALYHAQEMVSEGADILDVGGESTRPGHVRISEEEEIERVVPVIEALKKRFDTPISVDTYKSRVARSAADAGADLINDVWGLKYDEKMAEVIAVSGAACCLMHNREKAEYEDFLAEIKKDMDETIALARSAGISPEKIMLDPGIGFGKTYEMNLEMLRSLDSMHALGFPLLLGASRKSVVGLALDLPISERLEGTLVTTMLAVENGYSFVRVHDVKENLRVVKMLEAVYGAGVLTR